MEKKTPRRRLRNRILAVLVMIGMLLMLPFALLNRTLISREYYNPWTRTSNEPFIPTYKVILDIIAGEEEG